MDEKYLMLLDLFISNKDKIMNTKELSLKSGFSSRSILRYINIINSLDDNSPFKISLIKNKGYKLEILNEDRFNSFYNDVFKLNTIQENSGLLFRMVMNDITMNQLMDELNYSEASIVRLFKSINEKLSSRRLKIKRKKNTLYYEGNEIQIRNFGHYLWKLQDFDTACLTESLTKEYKKYCEYLKKNRISDSEELQSYLFISLIRSVKGHNVSFSPIIMDFYNKDNSQDELKIQMTRYYSENYQKEISRDEIVYCSLALKGNKKTGFNENVNEIIMIVSSILRRIDNRYETDFAADEELLNSICSHVASNISNYLLMSKADNSLLNQIRLNYTNEHVYALELANALSEMMDIRISDEDIGYLTLHFANCNEKKIKDNNIDSTIVYSQSLTTAKILQLRLSNLFPQMKVDIKKKNERVNKNNLKIVYEDDFAEEEFIKITPFMNEDDKKTIERALIEKNGYEPFIKMCSRNEFYMIEKAKTKDELLQQITETLINKGKLSKEEAGNIIERENLSSTEIVSGVSFPHCIVRSNSFISIIVLKHPVYWHSNHVKLVLVMGYNKNNK